MKSISIILSLVLVAILLSAWNTDVTASSVDCAALCGGYKGYDISCLQQCVKLRVLAEDSLDDDTHQYVEEEEEEEWEEALNDLMEEIALKEERAISLSESNSMSSAIDAGDAWGRYRGELIRFLKKFSPTSNGFDGLQIATAPIPAEWDTNPELFQRLCDGGSTWNQAYTPNFGKSFIANYRDFLLSTKTDPSSGQAGQQLESLQNTLVAKENQLFDEKNTCEDRFDRYPVKGMTFADFSSRYCPRYVSLEAEVTTLRGQMEMLMKQAYGGSKNYSSRRALSQYLQTTDRKWREVGSLAQFVSRAKKNQFNSFSLTVSKKSTLEKSSFKSKSWGFNIIVVSVNSAKKEVKLTTSLEQFDMHFSAKSWAAITVEPDSKWYHAGVINDWANGPFKPGKSRSNFFGPNGSINMFPRTFYVVYKPKIVMRLNKADTEKLEKEKKFGISVMSVFGIGFNFGKSSRFSSLKEKDDVFRVEIEGNDDTPHIIAAQMAVLP